MDERTQSRIVTDFSAAILGTVAVGDMSSGRAVGAAERSRIAASAARSASNIANWSTYLPLDCVKSMIRMGWDLST